MIGVDRPASSFFFHSRLLPSPPSGFHFSTSPFSDETRFCCGPRQFGQSRGSLVAAPLAIGSAQITISKRLARLLERRLIRGSPPRNCKNKPGTSRETNSLPGRQTLP